MLASSSPRLVAANHVLHRHSTPRHPPHAHASFFFCPLSLRGGVRCEGLGGRTPCDPILFLDTYSYATVLHQQMIQLGEDHLPPDSRCLFDDVSASRVPYQIRKPHTEHLIPPTSSGTRRVISSVVKVQKPSPKRRLRQSPDQPLSIPQSFHS